MNNYKQYQSFKSWTPKSFGVNSLEETIYFDQEFKLIQASNLNNKVVVEMGFGNGSFASWALEQGCDYFGFELIPELVSTAKDLGLNVFDAELSFDEVLSANSVDYVFAWDVFEHLSSEEISSKLLECYKVLKPGGRVMARVPSGDSPFSGPLQNGDITHKTSIGSSMVRQYAMAAGFNVESIRSPAFPLRGMGIKTFFRRTLVAVFQRITYPFIANVFMGGEKVVITQNMIFILKKP